MAEKLPSIFLLSSYLFISGVFSMSILTIENKCNYTVWPVIFSWEYRVSTSGFALKKDEARVIHAPSLWYGLISGRTECSTDSSTGNFSCATGDCNSHKIECPGTYDWAPVTYAYFRIDYDGTNSYFISGEYGYNIPLMVVPSKRSLTCFSSGCMVDLNKTCPEDLIIFNAEEKPIGCSSECQKYKTAESCCKSYFKSKQNCKRTLYSENFERVCPLVYTYAYSDYNTNSICSNSTNFVITFCPSSVPNTTR